MTVVKNNIDINIKVECGDHKPIWFPVHTFFDLNNSDYMVDCVCLKCKIVHTFPKNLIIRESTFIPIDLCIIIPLSMALSDYKTLCKCYQDNSGILDDNKQDKIICKTMKKRYANRY